MSATGQAHRKWFVWERLALWEPGGVAWGPAVGDFLGEGSSRGPSRRRNTKRVLFRKVIWVAVKAVLSQGDRGQATSPISWSPRAGKPSPESLRASGLPYHVLSSSPGSGAWRCTEISFLEDLAGQKRALLDKASHMKGWTTAAGGNEGRLRAAPISKESRDSFGGLSFSTCPAPIRCLLFVE